VQGVYRKVVRILLSAAFCPRILHFRPAAKLIAAAESYAKLAICAVNRSYSRDRNLG
jgi:hypothetical protein